MLVEKHRQAGETLVTMATETVTVVTEQTQ